MFNYLMKSLPAQYVFGGYNVRKSLSIVTATIDGQLVYDIFEYTYVDSNISFYILMENGKYKNVEEKIEVDVIDGESLASKHLFRGNRYNLEDYPTHDKDQIIGVFGVRNFIDLMKQSDDMDKANGNGEMSLQAMLDTKKAYTGMEVMGAIKRFNRGLGFDNKRIQVPAIKNDFDDPYESVFGDMFEFYDFLSNKSSDDVIRALVELDNSIDGVGNKK
ncbi:MAG: hypothetical protein IJ475_01060 [Bacilli bacterium]|nr:hypothetical protein [Bacilli bacterium]